jgi:hypothetical protein
MVIDGIELLPGDVFSKNRVKYTVYNVVLNEGTGSLDYLINNNNTDYGSDVICLDEFLHPRYILEPGPLRLEMMKDMLMAGLGNDRPPKEDSYVLPADKVKISCGGVVDSAEYTVTRINYIRKDQHIIYGGINRSPDGYGYGYAKRYCTREHIVEVTKGDAKLSLLPLRVSADSPCPLREICVYDCPGCAFSRYYGEKNIC